MENSLERVIDKALSVYARQLYKCVASNISRLVSGSPNPIFSCEAGNTKLTIIVDCSGGWCWFTVDNTTVRFPLRKDWARHAGNKVRSLVEQVAVNNELALMEEKEYSIAVSVHPSITGSVEGVVEKHSMLIDWLSLARRKGIGCIADSRDNLLFIIWHGNKMIGIWTSRGATRIAVLKKVRVDIYEEATHTIIVFDKNCYTYTSKREAVLEYALQIAEKCTSTPAEHVKKKVATILAMLQTYYQIPVNERKNIVERLRTLPCLKYV